MNLRLTSKLASLFVISLLLLVPLGLIDGLVSERQRARDAVVQDIGRSAGYSQTLVGPLLIIPYTRKVRSESAEVGGQPRVVETEIEGELALLPSELVLTSELGVDELTRGVYRARIYDADSRLEGSFEPKPDLGLTTDLADYELGRPLLVIGISDVRGIGAELSLRWGDAILPLEPGTGTDLLPSGVHAVLPPLDLARLQRTEFAVSLSLRGTTELQVLPVGRESRVVLRSSWPHPSFIGALSPRQRELRSDGFEALWHTTFFATNLEDVVRGCTKEGASAGCPELATRSFGVRLIDPVDHYLQSERAIKYAVLFIVLTFAAFLSFEVLRGVSLHPIQYGLVGLSLAVFFLLLLSLSEHVGFASAYLASAAPSVLLISYYASHALGGRSRAIGLGCALAVSYAVLYAILGSEDHALLIGAGVVFAALAAVMVLTREVDWARFGQPPSAPHAR